MTTVSVLCRPSSVLRLLRRRRLLPVFLADLLPALDALLLLLHDLGRDVEEGRAQRAGIDIAGELDADLRRRLAPGEVGLDRSGGHDVEDDVLRRLEVAALHRVAQGELRPGTHPGVDRPEARGAELTVGIVLMLGAEMRDLALDDLLQLHEFQRLAMAV